MTGSTARARRTPLSDLDLHIVGARPRFADLNEVDLYATSVETLWERLLDGDDFIQWTLRYGCILFDEGVLREALIHVVEHNLWPDPQRKHNRTEELLAFAERVIDTADVEAAQEQARAAMTAVVRWVLLANGEFPLARDELADQILHLGSFDLAAVLSRLIHTEPSIDELRAGIELGRRAISLSPAGARHAALARIGSLQQPPLHRLC